MIFGKNNVFALTLLFLFTAGFFPPLEGSASSGLDTTILQVLGDPGNKDEQAALARVYNSRGEPGKAYSAAKSVLQHDPEHAAALLEFAHAARGLGRYTESVQAYSLFLASSPSSVEALAGNSESLAKTGMWKEAFAAAMTAIRIAPGRSEGYAALGRVYRLEGRFLEAIDVLTQGRKIDGSNPSLLYDLGLCYALTWNRGAAFAIYEELESLDKRLAGLLFDSILP